ncbi:MAG: histidine kinase, partial [Nitrospira sp.]|nr:histidine kinase [Nitrospira sp.]
TFVNALPDFLGHGKGIVVAVSLVSGTITNFMSDGATVASVGPVMLPMAQLGGAHIWQVGLACAFASSFANFLIVGTPNNAIAFAMGKDPETGERLLQATDFVKYGLPVLLIAWTVLWGWAVFGYWQLLDWPAIK